jgi:cytochrome c biogenesis protein
VLLAIAGLLGSLFIRPRRAWVRVRRDGGRTVVELAGLDRSSGGDLVEEVDELEARIQQQVLMQKETS